MSLCDCVVSGGRPLELCVDIEYELLIGNSSHCTVNVAVLIHIEECEGLAVLSVELT